MQANVQIIPRKIVGFAERPSCKEKIRENKEREVYV